MIRLASRFLVLGLLLLGCCSSGLADDPLSVCGTVLNGDGAPIPGADVMAVTIDWDPRKRDRIAHLRAKTDSRGRFHLPEALKQYPLDGFVYTVIARGYSAATEVASPAKRDLRFTLQPEARMRAKIVDKADKPVRGASLFLWSASSPLPPRGSPPGPGTRHVTYGMAGSELCAPPSDKDGIVELGHLPRNGSVTLRMRDANWVIADPNAPLLGALTGGDDRVAMGPTYVVRPAARVRGRLVTESGRPVPNYKIHANASGTFSDYAWTNANGEFEITGLYEGRQMISIYGPAGADFVSPGDLFIPLKVSDNRRIRRIVCPKGSLVKGRIVDSVGKRGVPGFRVLAFGRGECTNDYSAQTDDEGRFAVRVRPGQWGLALSAPRQYESSLRARGSLVFKAQSGKDIDVGTVNVTLRPLKPVVGKVLKPDGTPAAGAVVLYLHPSARPQLLSKYPHVRAREDGTFETPPLNWSDSGPRVLRAYLQNWSTSTDLEVDLREVAEPQPVLLRLADRPLGKLEGRVLDQRGNPVSGASITLDSGTIPYDDPYSGLPRTDGEGRYSLDVWPNLEYQVHVGAAKHSFALGEKARPAVGETIELRPLFLRRAESFLELAIIDAAGKPMANSGVAIQALPESSYYFGFDRGTDAQGRLRVNEVLPGRYRIEISNGYEREVVEVEAGKSVEIRLQKISVRRPMLK